MPKDFRLDQWTIRPERRLIERDGGEALRLRPKAMAVLECLVAANGEPVSRDQLFSAAWPGAEVSDDTLTQSIVELRKAFGETARDARVIQTIPKMGFRLVPKAQALEPSPEGDDSASRVTALPEAAEIVAGGQNSMLPRWIVGGMVLVLGLLAWYYLPDRDRRPVLQLEEVQTLAILPFLDLSRNQDQAYFSSGLAEELQVNLAQLRGLRVTGRVSTAYINNRELELAEIGEHLNVEHILEGSVRESGDQLRVSAKLIEVEKGYQLWSDSYDLDPEDLFRIQDQIAESVATALSITLSVGDLGLVAGGTRNLAAYETYLQGWDIYLEGSPRAHLESLEYFKRAAELDPNYGLAWERIAHLYLRLPSAVAAEREIDWLAESRQALSRALKVAPDAPAVLATAAVIYARHQQWQEAGTMYLQAEKLPTQGLALPLLNFGNYFMAVGRMEEAILMFERARQIEPLWAMIAQQLGWAYMNEGQHKKAEAEFQRGYDLSEKRIAIPGLAAVMSDFYGDEEAEEKWGARWRAHIIDNDKSFLPFFALVEADRDNIERQRAWLMQFYGDTGPGPLDPLAAMQAGLHGFADLALKFSRRTPATEFFWMPWYAEMRKLEGFKLLVQEVGLVDYWREFGWGDYCRPIAGEGFECKPP